MARRVSEVHALSMDSDHLRFSNLDGSLILTVFTNTSQTLPDIRSGAVLNFTRPDKILQD